MPRYPALFALILLVLALIVNFILQPNMFARDTLNSNMRVFLPIILLAAGQAVVILGGGIDISVGAIVSIVNTILATRVGLEGSPEAMWQYVAVSLLVGVLAGAINGFFVAYLRFQPIITTYATSFLFAGFALFILPNPGGGIPAQIAELYRSTSRWDLPLAFYVIAIVLGLWGYIRSTRYGNYLFAVGGKAQAAYETAVPVTQVQFSTYVISGLMAAFSGIRHHHVERLRQRGNWRFDDPQFHHRGGDRRHRHERRRGRRGRAGDGRDHPGTYPEYHFVCPYRHLVGDTGQGDHHRGGAGYARHHQSVQEARMKRISISPPVAALLLAVVLFLLSGLLPNGYGSDLKSHAPRR